MTNLWNNLKLIYRTNQLTFLFFWDLSPQRAVEVLKVSPLVPFCSGLRLFCSPVLITVESFLRWCDVTAGFLYSAQAARTADKTHPQVSVFKSIPRISVHISYTVKQMVDWFFLLSLFPTPTLAPNKCQGKVALMFTCRLAWRSSRRPPCCCGAYRNQRF